MVKSDIPILINDIAFVGFIVLFLLYAWLFLSTVASMRSPTSRQARLKTNRFLLHLRRDESKRSGTPKLPSTIRAAAQEKDGNRPVLRQCKLFMCDLFVLK